MDNKIGKSLLLTIPTILLPYSALFALVTVFFSSRSSFFGFIMRNIFGGNALYILLVVFLFCIVSTALTAVYLCIVIRSQQDAIVIAKTAMIVKLIQIPGYIAIFVIGVAMMLTIFTFAFSIALLLLDCLLLVLSGLIMTVSVINANRQGVYPIKESFWCIILQFVFCADVIATIIYYKKLKGRQQSAIDA